MSIKPFAEQGHYTAVHDAIFDEVMPVCPPNAWKVLCYIVRKTRGWNKESAQLTCEAIREGTGIKSDSTLRRTLEWLSGHRELLTEYMDAEVLDALARPGYVYVLEHGGVYKIGRSAEPEKRIAQISPILPYPISVVCIAFSEDYVDLERRLHLRFQDVRLNGEWFDLSIEDLERVKEMME